MHELRERSGDMSYKFIAVRLPYETQFDEHDAQASVDFIDPDERHTVNIGPAVKSALAGSISRQLKPRWVAPQGAEAELLVTVLAWDLNLDGTLNGNPRVVRQEGITEANRAQAQRHAEQAIRAVKLAAPFNLPPQYYPAWKRIADFRFDRKLSQ